MSTHLRYWMTFTVISVFQLYTYGVIHWCIILDPLTLYHPYWASRALTAYHHKYWATRLVEGVIHKITLKR